MSTLQRLQQSLKAGEITIVQVVNGCLSRAEESKHLNAYVELFTDEIRQSAQDLDNKIKHAPEDLGELFGLVISIKDVICYKDHGVSASSDMLRDFVSQYTSTALQRLLDQDALVIGRTNCDEFAMGSSNEHSAYGPVINALGENRVPGGSSGGAAVSVQVGSCHIALGSDTGGSVRQPAAFCDLIGFKPTYGRISRYGLIAYGSSFDQIGLIGRDVEDMAKTFRYMAGQDAMDSTSSHESVEGILPLQAKQPLRYAYLEEVMNHKSLADDQKSLLDSFMDKLKLQGNVVEGTSFALLDYLVPCYYVLTTAEASSNLGRYDGIRYGHRSKESSDIDSLYYNSRTEGFGLEVKRRIMLGTFVLSSGYYDAYYTQAQKIRRMITDALRALFNDYDCLILPCGTGTAWEIGTYEEDPVKVYLSDIFTVLANIAGIPAVSIPLGKDRVGMPYGVQLLTTTFSEKLLLSATRDIVSWHSS